MDYDVRLGVVRQERNYDLVRKHSVVCEEMQESYRSISKRFFNLVLVKFMYVCDTVVLLRIVGHPIHAVASIVWALPH